MFITLPLLLMSLKLHYLIENLPPDLEFPPIGPTTSTFGPLVFQNFPTIE
jgi:hypothetical protein